MAFDRDYFGRWPSTANEKAPTAFLYSSSTDALATITASAYFNTTINRLKVGTLIYVTASDLIALLEVTSVTTNVTTDVILTNASAGGIIASGQFTTAGGDATETITATGAVATDVAIVTLHTAGATPRTVDSAVAATDAITVTLSGDPSTDHVLNYVLVRAF